LSSRSLLLPRPDVDSSVSVGSYGQFNDNVVVKGMKKLSNGYDGYSRESLSRIRGHGRWSIHAGWGVKSCDGRGVIQSGRRS
jgi:hypothetical protein